jgi:hypothetical protein
LRSTDADTFKKKLEKCKFIDEAKQKEIDEFFESIGCKDGWMTMEQAEKYHERYPLLTRDNGAQILEMINESDESECWVQDSTNFAGDSLFCEWAYVIDYDKGNFEIYRGFNKKPLAKNQRFKYLEGVMEADDAYYPVRMIKKYKFDELPLSDEFLEWAEELDKKEEAEYEKEEKKKAKA